MASDEAQKLEPLRLELQLQAHQLNWPLHVGPPLSNQGAFGRVFDGLWTSTQEAVVIKYQRHSRTNRYVTMLDIQSLKSQSEQACTHTPYMMLYFDQGGLPEYRLYPLQKSIVPVEYYVGVKATLCQTLPAAQAKAYFDIESLGGYMIIFYKITNGITVQQYIQQNPVISERQAKNIIILIILNMHLVKRSLVYHNDLTASNMFLQTQPYPRVLFIDFGDADVMDGYTYNQLKIPPDMWTTNYPGGLRGTFHLIINACQECKQQYPQNISQTFVPPQQQQQAIVEQSAMHPWIVNDLKAVIDNPQFPYYHWKVFKT